MHIEFEFDRQGSKELRALEEIVLALEASPQLADRIRSGLGSTLDDLEEIVGVPLISFTASADKMIVRLEPSEGLSKLLSAVRTWKGRGDVIDVAQAR